MPRGFRWHLNGPEWPFQGPLGALPLKNLFLQNFQANLLYIGVIFARQQLGAGILTTKEKLAAMGFPVYERLSRAMGVPLLEFPDLKRAKQFLGNAMHAGSAGVVP